MVSDLKHSMHNVVWYDGVDAYVSKFVLKTNEEQAEEDVRSFWSINRCVAVILKIDLLYVLNFENIIALKTELTKIKTHLDILLKCIFRKEVKKI